MVKVNEIFDLKKKKYGLYNELEMLPYLLEHNYVKFILYGTGEYAEWFIDWIGSIYNIKPKFIVDEGSQKKEVCGIPVLSYDKFANKKDEKYFVVVADEAYEEPEYKKRLLSQLKEKGAIIIFNAHRVMRVVWPDWYVYIKHNIDKFEQLYNRLCDDISRDTLVHYLKTYVTGDRYDGVTFPEECKYWGGDGEQYSLFKREPNEVVLNLGGCCGDTIFQFLKNGYSFEKIISVEADDTNLGYLNRSIGLLNDEIRQKIQVDNCYIGAESATIDELYAGEKISLIEMDIEGAELSALETGINLIKKNRPVLAICVYHKKDDLIEIPEFISRNFENYILALRKYPSFLFEEYPGIQQINELVLYAIPKERFIEK